MTAHKALFSAHFDELKRSALADLQTGSRYMAHFARVYASRPHRTKQIRTLVQGDENGTYDKRMVAFDNARASAKKALSDARAIGFPADAPACERLAEARRALYELLLDLVTRWQTALDGGWSNDAGDRLLQHFVSQYDEVNARIKAMRDRLVAFRVELTKHLNSAAYRAAADSEAFRALLAALQANPPPLKQRKAPTRAVEAAGAEEEDEGSGEPDGIDLGADDSDSAAHEELDDVLIVVDDAAVEADDERTGEDFFDEVSASSEESSSSISAPKSDDDEMKAELRAAALAAKAAAKAAKEARIAEKYEADDDTTSDDGEAAEEEAPVVTRRALPPRKRKPVFQEIVDAPVAVAPDDDVVDLEGDDDEDDDDSDESFHGDERPSKVARRAPAGDLEPADGF